MGLAGLPNAVAYLALAVFAGMAYASGAGPSAKGCERVVIDGDVASGREWSLAVGQGWVLRVLPIKASESRYSGWDLVMDRDRPAGFPDALLLSTPPYNSINEREIATTFGLRAQDAIGWNPRSFRFLTDPTAFRQSQQLFLSLSQRGLFAATAHTDSPGGMAERDAMRQLMDLQQRSASGEFRILDARLVPGVGDPAPFAQSWALTSARTPHVLEASPPGGATPLGELKWIRFSVTLWLPTPWKAPPRLRVIHGLCPE